MKKTCCIFNLAPHYREAVFLKLNSELECDFYIGDRVSAEIKTMDYNKLSGFKGVLRYISIYKNFYWQKGAIGLSFKPYNNYILSGEPYCLSTWLILFINKLLGKKSYLWTHGWYGDETILKRMFKKAFFGLGYKIFLYGNYARNLMIKEGFDSEKLICVYNSLDYSKQLLFRSKLKFTDIYKDHFKNELPVLIYIGRVQKSKKLNLLINALSLLNKEGEKVNLVIIGSIVDDPAIEDQVNQLSLNEYVWFYGESYDEALNSELIFNADVCVSPGNVGLTAIHCLGYGTPIITHSDFKSQGPEFEAIVEGTTGMYFEADNFESLAMTIKSWFFSHSKKELEITKACYKIVDEVYNPNNQVGIIKSNLN